MIALATGRTEAPHVSEKIERPKRWWLEVVNARLHRQRGVIGCAYVTRVEAVHRYDVPVDRGFAFITDTANWSKYWPGYVRLEDGSSWGDVGDTARLTIRLLGRERVLTMTITAFEPNRLVTYTTTQPGLPDASHERHFEPDGDGFLYRLVVDYEPRGGIAGFFDRTLVERGIRRAFESTFAALEQELVRA